MLLILSSFSSFFHLFFPCSSLFFSSYCDCFVLNSSWTSDNLNKTLLFEKLDFYRTSLETSRRVAVSGYLHAMKYHRAANLMDYVFRVRHDLALSIHIYMLACLFACLPAARQSVCPVFSSCLFVCISVCLSMCLCVNQLTYLVLSQSVSQCLSIANH